MKKTHTNKHNLSFCSLTGYSTAVSGLIVTGVLSPSANAAVLHTDIPDLTANMVTESITIDLDQSGPGPYARINNYQPADDFQFRATGRDGVMTGLTYGTTQNAAYYILKLSAGATIDSSLPWHSGVSYFDFYNYPAPVWNTGGEGYIGLRIRNGADYNYGWAHIEYSDVADTMTVREFAIEQVANAPITAGDTVGVIIPEASSALLLALGVGGTALRRRRSTVAA